jgi:hypothetical protein
MCQQLDFKRPKTIAVALFALMLSKLATTAEDPLLSAFIFN